MSRNPDIAAGIDAACDAAIEAFAEATDGDDLPDVRLMLIASVGDPANLGETEVRLAAPDDVRTSVSQKSAMLVASLRAIAPELYDSMMSGLDRLRSNQPRRRGH
ncbi:MAG TPA: hypothetical protein VK501_18455 [Baekduia sp.]|uniref:hypothetical protein n=1 Tax=Baekduia sp. TaxID=2600305 RepID=UPI002CBBEA9B|nr:hypothetical protein [Baekduia sp.]HMJ35892.1 hypothetical protein [Baekduia sp.]